MIIIIIISGTCCYNIIIIIMQRCFAGSAASSSVPTVCRVAVRVIVVWVYVPWGYSVRIPGDGQVTVSRCVDPVGRVHRVVVDGLVAGPCRVVHAQDWSEHSSARCVVVGDFRCPHVVRSCTSKSHGIDKRKSIR